MGASYDKPIRHSYFYNAIDIGSGNSQRTIMGPKGKTGRVAFVSASVTTSFVGTTTPGYVRVGDGTTDALYAQLALGAAGAGTAANAAVAADTTSNGLSSSGAVSDPQAQTNSTPGQNSNNMIVKFVAPTGGSPAGVADVLIEVDWY